MNLAVAMSERVGGAALRRRDRRLLAWHRHVKLMVAMELTTLHHSAQRQRPVMEVPSEGVEGETRDVPLHQKPIPGCSPGCLEGAGAA